MCRLLGIVAAEPYAFELVLRDAPRSMAVLSHDHSDGWGLATHGGDVSAGWWLRRSTLCACDDEAFQNVVVQARGRMLVAHVRQRSVGPIEVANTHPFLRGRWLFAHNGTINDLDFLRAHCSPERLIELGGTTDSELFFSYLLTHLDEAGVTDAPASAQSDAAVRKTVGAAVTRPGFGSINFLLSNGTSLYAHRFGKELFLLDRTIAEPEEAVSPLEGVGRRRCVAIASEPITAEPWKRLEAGTLLRVDLSESPRWSLVS